MPASGLQDLCTVFPFERQAGSGGLAAFNDSVAALAAISDRQRREVVRVLRRYRCAPPSVASRGRAHASLFDLAHPPARLHANPAWPPAHMPACLNPSHARSRSAARANWAHAIEAAMQRWPRHQLPGTPEGGTTPVQPAADAPARDSAFAGAAAAAAPRVAGGRPVVAAREASLATWLHRGSPSRAANGGTEAAPAAGEAAAAEAGDTPVGETASRLDGQAEAASPSVAAASGELPDLAAALPAEVPPAEVPDASGGAAPGDSSAGPVLTPAAEPLSIAARSGSFDLLAGSYSQPLPPRGLVLPAGGIPPGLFPETTEGHLAQASSRPGWPSRAGPRQRAPACLQTQLTSMNQTRRLTTPTLHLPTRRARAHTTVVHTHCRYEHAHKHSQPRASLSLHRRLPGTASSSCVRSLGSSLQACTQR